MRFWLSTLSDCMHSYHNYHYSWLEYAFLMQLMTKIHARKNYHKSCNTILLLQLFQSCLVNIHLNVLECGCQILPVLVNSVHCLKMSLPTWCWIIWRVWWHSDIVKSVITSAQGKKRCQLKNHDHEHKRYIYTDMQLQYCVQIKLMQIPMLKNLLAPFISEVEANSMYPTVIHLGHLVTRQMLRMTYQAVM